MSYHQLTRFRSSFAANPAMATDHGRGVTTRPVPTRCTHRKKSRPGRPLPQYEGLGFCRSGFQPRPNGGAADSRGKMPLVHYELLLKKMIHRRGAEAQRKSMTEVWSPGRYRVLTCDTCCGSHVGVLHGFIHTLKPVSQKLCVFASLR